MNKRIFAGLCTLLVACHQAMPTVTVQGDPGWIAAMVGRWEGTYESEKTGREGTLQFELAGVGDTARGEILMLPAWSDEPFQGSNRGEPREPRPLRSPTVIPIRFVKIEGGQVLGQLDPYLDPDCRCKVTTSFIGSVDGEDVQGIFAIRGMSAWLAFGEWRAHRVKRGTVQTMASNRREP
ncbi:MAG TPA: hypothetical protein VG817_00645 [Gemmatimonadales bacterium]|nr:hypothetical protein [Gemmatimonadales bacterium]